MARWISVVWLCMSTLFFACSGADSTSSEPAVDGGNGDAAAQKQEVLVPSEPTPGLMMVQAQFIQVDGKPVPGPAKMVLIRNTADGWSEEIIEDPESNVFHKAMWWNDGILTIGAMAAKLVHWKKQDAKWEGSTLWERSWNV